MSKSAFEGFLPRTRVKVIRTPLTHSSGDKSPECTCKGRIGTVMGTERVGRENICFVSFDDKGQAGIPPSCLMEVVEK